VKVACSTPHVFLDVFMPESNEDEALEAATGLKTRTSTKDLSDLPHQN